MELHPYEHSYRQKMDQFAPDLAAHLDRVPTLPPDYQRAVLTYVLELACQAQNQLNIDLGRAAIWNMPRAWVLAHIEAAAEFLLQFNDEWEYRRLIEVYWHMDIALVKRLVERGLANTEADIQAVALECLAQLKEYRLEDHQGPPGFDYWQTPADPEL